MAGRGGQRLGRIVVGIVWPNPSQVLYSCGRSAGTVIGRSLKPTVTTVYIGGRPSDVQVHTSMCTTSDAVSWNTDVHGAEVLLQVRLDRFPHPGLAVRRGLERSLHGFVAEDRLPDGGPFLRVATSPSEHGRTLRSPA